MTSIPESTNRLLSFGNKFYFYHMKLLNGFFQLIRWPNLVFIVVTQLLFQFCIIRPAFVAAGESLPTFHHFFWWLVVASVLIAAAGYIINDYFDLNIDLVNKPDKLVVEKIIHRRWVILWHLLLSFIGIGISFYIGFKCNMIELGFANMACVFLLFVYSTTLKKKLLIGNLLISLLTAWVVLVIGLENIHLLIEKNSTVGSAVDIGRLTRITFLYAGFAFTISLIREVIKDCEDMEGDSRYGCKTMPIVWGITTSKVFTATLLVLMVGGLVITQIYVLQFGHWMSTAYSFSFVTLPLVYILWQLKNASGAKGFHQLSSWVKWVMLTGICSMAFFIHQ
jgi:4-hydroxybenzoate polyprenyltransferase